MTVKEEKHLAKRTFSVTVDGKGRMTADLPSGTSSAPTNLTPEAIPSLLLELARQTLEQLSSDHEPTFVIVDDESDSYVQAAGSKDRLTIEWRQYATEESFEHFVAGRKQEPGDIVQVKTFYGVVDVNENECLQSEDGYAIFEAFIKSGERPSTYEWRNSTANFEN